MNLDTLLWARDWKKGLIFGVLLLLSAAILVKFFGDTAAYIFHLRVPILFGILILGFPLLALYTQTGGSMFRNLFVQPNWQQVSYIVISVVIASLAVAITFDSIYSNAPIRYDLPGNSGLSQTALIIVVIFLSLPTLWGVYRCSKGVIPLGKQAIVNVNLGFAVGIVASVTLIYLTLQFNQSITFRDLVEPIALLFVSGEPGYMDGKSLVHSHANATAFAFIALIIYVFGGFKLRPWHRVGKVKVPAILYLNIIATFICLLFAGATFYFDKSHIPVFLGFLLVSAIAYVVFKVDHFYEILKDTNSKKPGVPADFASIINARLARQDDDNKTMVVMCASGGGIQAGAWAAKVMTGLQQEPELSDSFCRAITLISSVSGGSVGSLFYLDRFDSNGVLPQDQIPDVFKGATQDSMDSVGWGLAYPDLLRFIGLPWLPPKLLDRGTVIEEDWKTGLKSYESKNPADAPFFSNWRQKILNGDLPIPAFNATIVDNGKRFLISPVSFGQHALKQCVDFTSEFVDADLHAVSAARLSATFPYVSPIARNTDWPNSPNYHVADGGFFDNYGVFTALEWLHHHVLPLKKDKKIKLDRILFIEIHAFPKDPDTGSEKSVPGDGWQTALFGPLKVLANARGTTQLARNSLEVQSVTVELAEQGITLEPVVISFPKIDSPSDPGKPYEPPLSWKLSPEEIKAIHDAWKSIVTDKNGPVQRIKDLWK